MAAEQGHMQAARELSDYGFTCARKVTGDHPGTRGQSLGGLLVTNLLLGQESSAFEVWENLRGSVTDRRALLHACVRIAQDCLTLKCDAPDPLTADICATIRDL